MTQTLDLGRAPLVVGTLSQAPTWKTEPGRMAYPCDVVEIRLDLLGDGGVGWLDLGRAIQASGYPVILTLRLKAEGGAWDAEDEARKAVLTSAVRNLAAVDIELRSPLAPGLCRLAGRLGKSVIVSYHNFDATPSLEELRDIVTRARVAAAAIPKVATLVRNEEDLRTLRRLLDLDWGYPLCVLGMGPMGPRTRSEFPALGSCLTYGYLDTPVAPGQISARELTASLRPVSEQRTTK
jgi:3-dehydroquinate dehydratase I